MVIVFSGLIGQAAGLGGGAWAVMQYLIGLRELGHDVYYLEDCGDWSSVYHWETGEQTNDPEYPAAYVRACLEPAGFKDRWSYRVGDVSIGMPRQDVVDVCSQADVIIMRALSLSAWRPEYDRAKRRAFIDVDPGFTQIRLANGDAALEERLRRFDRLFTFGMRIGEPDCSIPTAGWRWHRTVPPVALSAWPVGENRDATHFTTIMKWRGFMDVEFGGARYGQKDASFPEYFDLPSRTPQPFRLAVLGTDLHAFTSRGWSIVPGEVASGTPDRFRQFIRESRGEFSVPKHAYSATRSGWFSDRSVCYLAAGRPVLVGDTAIGDFLPTGTGVVTFRNVDEAVTGLETINADYDGHRRAARGLAESHFATERVLPPLLDEAMS